MVATFDLCCSLYKYPIFPLLVGSLGGHSFGVGLNSFFPKMPWPFESNGDINLCCSLYYGYLGSPKGVYFWVGLNSFF